MQKKIFKIKGMNCEACAKMIELDLEEAGIKFCSCNYAKQSLEVKYDNNNKLNEELIKKIVEESGFSIL